MSTVLEIFQILLCELQRRFRQQNADELLPDIERQSAFGIRDLGAGDCRLILGGLQTPLPFVAALK